MLFRFKNLRAGVLLLGIFAASAPLPVFAA